MPACLPASQPAATSARLCLGLNPSLSLSLPAQCQRRQGCVCMLICWPPRRRRATLYNACVSESLGPRRACAACAAFPLPPSAVQVSRRVFSRAPRDDAVNIIPRGTAAQRLSCRHCLPSFRRCRRLVPSSNDASPWPAFALCLLPDASLSFPVSSPSLLHTGIHLRILHPHLILLSSPTLRCGPWRKSRHGTTQTDPRRLGKPSQQKKQSHTRGSRS